MRGARPGRGKPKGPLKEQFKVQILPETGARIRAAAAAQSITQGQVIDQLAKFLR